MTVFAGLEIAVRKGQGPGAFGLAVLLAFALALWMCRIIKRSLAARAELVAEVETKDLLHNERQLHPVADIAPVGLVHCDTELRYKFVNRNCAERRGATPEQVVGKRIAEMADPKSWATFEPYFRECLAGKRVSSMTKYLTRLATRNSCMSASSRSRGTEKSSEWSRQASPHGAQTCRGRASRGGAPTPPCHRQTPRSQCSTATQSSGTSSTTATSEAAQRATWSYPGPIDRQTCP